LRRVRGDKLQHSQSDSLLRTGQRRAAAAGYRVLLRLCVGKLQQPESTRNQPVVGVTSERENTRDDGIGDGRGNGMRSTGAG